MHTYIVRFISSFQRILYVSLSRLCLSNNNFNNETLLLSEIIFYHLNDKRYLLKSCLLESRHEKSVQLISAARQYNQSVIIRHLLWSNTVLIWPGQKPRIQFIAIDFFLFCNYLSACPPVYLCVQPSVHPSLCLFTRLFVRPSVRPSVCMSVPVRLTAYPPVRLCICVHSNVRKKSCTLGILISTHTL